MKISHDYSYIPQGHKKLVEYGYGKITVGYFKIDRHYSDEQKTENAKQAAVLTKEQWSQRCDDDCFAFYQAVQGLFDTLHKKYHLYQYSEVDDHIDGKDIYRSALWGLYFYSNRGWNGKDYYDHVSLSLNKNRTEEENDVITKEVIRFFEDADIDRAYCRVQYHAELDNTLLYKVADDFINSFPKDCFVNWHGMEGKFKMLNTDFRNMDDEEYIRNHSYGFFKKNSKGRYYSVKPEDIVLQTLKEENTWKK